MELWSERARAAVHAFAGLALGNPFLPERVEHERRALGEAFVPLARVWHQGAQSESANVNVARLAELVEQLAPELRARVAAHGASADPEDLRAYQGLVFYLLYYRYLPQFSELTDRSRRGESTTGRVRDYTRYRDDVRHFLHLPRVRLPLPSEPAHIFAWGYQVRRAFDGTFHGIHGGSMPAARLRAAVWQSVFTHNSERYLASLYAQMGDVTTLVLGESGTGKELVARAIALARYIPFDEASSSFRSEARDSFRAVNLSALTPALIESELFGHRRGAFTGALQDRVGWLEDCSAVGTVFLDEIGELEASLQVKLLRVLQSRSFQRVGDLETRRFSGKLVAATNRDLPDEIGAGRFREDLYYRLCADVIHTPTLRAQIADSPDELPGLVYLVAHRIVGEAHASALAREVNEVVRVQLGLGYPWPGNVRELEQCVRNVLVRGAYHPAALRRPGADADLAARIRAGDLSADDLLRRYCTQVYALTGSYEETGRRLGLDRRTVKAKLDPELLEQLRRG